MTTAPISTGTNHLCFSEKVAHWIHKNPTTVKVIEIFALVIGIGLLASIPFVAPILGVAFIATAAIVGSLLLLSSIASMVGLNILIPPHHDMKNHMFQPGSCEGGWLYYEGDIPILSLDSDDPEKAGKAHGYLCGNVINKITQRLDFIYHGCLSVPRAAKLKKELDLIRQAIPP